MTKLIFIRFAAALLFGAASLNAFAVQRTFVASYGLDTNPCSISSPCRGLARALTQTDANGEVIVLDSAGYGAFILSQSVSIIAPDGVYAGISVFPDSGGTGLGRGITINGTGIKVTLRGLSLNGQGGHYGIMIINASEVHVEKCEISNIGVDVGGTGIMIQADGSRVFVSDTTIKDGTGNGIYVDATSQTNLTVSGSHIRRNAVGGIVLRTASRLSVTNSILTGNDAGIYLDGHQGAWVVTVDRSLLDGNATVGLFVGAGGDGSFLVEMNSSTVRGSGLGGGIQFGTSGATVVGFVTNSVVMDNSGAGITAGALTSVIVDGNILAGNGKGLWQQPGSVLGSSGRNVVERNTTDIVGSTTPVTLR